MEPTLERAVDRWHTAGIITPDTVAAIRSHEDARPADPADAALPAPSTTSRTDMVAEGLAYVGAALALGFGFAVFGGLWDDLGAFGRISLIVFSTLVVGGASAALDARHRGSVRRLSSVLAGLAVAGVALSVVLVLDELTDLDASVIAIIAGVVGGGVGVPVHLRRTSWPTTLALGATVLMTVFGLAETMDLLVNEVVIGVLLMGIGLSWAALGWAGRVHPRSAFEVTGLLAGGVGIQWMSFDGGRVTALVIGIVIAAATLAIGLHDERTSSAVLGGLGITVFAPQLVFQIFGDTLGAPLAVFVAGIALVAVSVTILRQRSEA